MERRGRARPEHPRRTTRGRARVAEPGNERGLTLIELVIAVSVFAILAGSVASVAGSGMGLVRNNRDRSVGANLASEDIDAVNQMDFTTLVTEQGSVVTKNVTVGGVSYTVKRAVAWTSTDAGTNICSYTAGGSTASWVLGVTTTVTWPNMTSPASAAVSTTTVSPPVGTSNGTNTGSVPVTVRSAAGTGVPGVTVAVTDGSSHNYSGLTDSNGCAFLLVAPSTYTLSLIGSGVDRQGNSSPSSVFSISGGSNVPVTLDYDTPGYLQLNATAPDGAPAPTGLPVTVSYQFFQPTGLKTFSSTGALPVTVSGLFPDSYTGWYGDCTDADPQYWSGARANPRNVRANQTASIATSLGAVSVLATQTGVPLAGATVTATHDSSSPATCPSGSPSVTGYTLGTTDSTGALEAALPWGNWLLKVTPPTGSPTTQSVQLNASSGSSAVPVTVAL